MSYASTLEYIHGVQWRGQKPGLSRIREMLAFWGNPEQQLKFVHIGGTNGKGSTAALTASVLRKAGYRVGLYTSPYINRFNERIQVDGQPIGDDELELLVDELRPFADRMEDLPSEFELITAVAMTYFLRKHCDIVVLEVGLGGEFDATNVIPCPEVAVLTAIGLDHTATLGPTIADIARTKAGIIKAGGTVVSYGHQPEADAEFALACQCQGAKLVPVDFDALRTVSLDYHFRVFDFGTLKGLKLPLLASYQPRNAAVAITAVRVLVEKGWHISEQNIRDGLEKTEWPGRFEVLGEHPVFLLDGSHNPHGMSATMDSLRELFPGRKFIFLLSVMADKDVAQMLDLLVPLAQQCFTVTADNPRAMPADRLAAMIHARGIPAKCCESIADGVRAAQDAAGGSECVCALGTLYFSGDVRRAFLAQTE